MCGKAVTWWSCRELNDYFSIQECPTHLKKFSFQQIHLKIKQRKTDVGQHTEANLLCGIWQCRWWRAVCGPQGGREGVVTQATGHHRSYWFVVSFVLQTLSLSHLKHPPYARFPPTCVPRAHVDTYEARIWSCASVGGCLCVLALCASGSECYVPHAAFSSRFSIYRYTGDVDMYL